MSTSLRMRESDVHGVNLLLFNHKGNLRSSRVQRLVTPLAPPTLIAGSIFFFFFFSSFNDCARGQSVCGSGYNNTLKRIGFYYFLCETSNKLI